MRALARPALVVLLAASGGAAATLRPPASVPLQQSIDAAAAGDVLELGPGERHGQFTISKPLTLLGATGAVLDGDGVGTVVRISAPDVVVRGLTIRRSGRDGAAMDSGVFIEQAATRAAVFENSFEENLFGVYLHGAAGATIRGNVIKGLDIRRRNEAGNGVSIWNAPDAVIAGNRISQGRDGVFVLASLRDHFLDNHFENLRYAIHYMYADQGEIAGNVSIGDDAGFVLMFSNNLHVRNNRSEHDRDYGFLLNFANRSELVANVVEAGPLEPGQMRGAASAGSEHAALVREFPERAERGPEKCVFIYNANRNRLTGNWFSGCDIGVHFTAGSEGDLISGNAFVGNRTQVKYVGTRDLDWSVDGRGNYWSDNAAFDLDGDGIADEAYRPNDAVDRALWRAPQAKLLLDSPALLLLRFAQRQFPALFPGGVVDSRPLMSPLRHPGKTAP